jgi:FMN-dependent NADH-azoreductase
MTLLRVDASIQGPRSASAELADLAQAEWTTAHPGVPVVRRDLGSRPLPADAWAQAVAAGYVPQEERTQEQLHALNLATTVAGELLEAEALILALPLYNFGVSQHVKTWIDVAIAGGGAGVPLLKDRPAVVVTTRGGSYAPGTPREGWDHNTAYLRTIIGDLWGADLTMVEREFTLVGVNPALDGFTEQAELLKKTAHEDAAAAGRALAGAWARGRAA